MSSHATRLRMEPLHTTLTTGSAEPPVRMDIGYQGVAERFLRHDPPTPGELESAIDAVEDALMRARVQRLDAGTLVGSEDMRSLLPALPLGRAAATLDEVEAGFQRLASASLGSPAARADTPQRAEAAASLVILRECMHHLGYARLMFA